MTTPSSSGTWMRWTGEVSLFLPSPRYAGERGQNPPICLANKAELNLRRQPRCTFAPLCLRKVLVMAISTRCVCGKKIWAADELAGQTARCTLCGRPVNFPIPFVTTATLEPEVHIAAGHLLPVAAKPETLA